MRLLTIREVAAQLGCSTKTVRRLITSGTLRAVRLGRDWRIDDLDLRAFIEMRRT